MFGTCKIMRYRFRTSLLYRAIVGVLLVSICNSQHMDTDMCLVDLTVCIRRSLSLQSTGRHRGNKMELCLWRLPAFYCSEREVFWWPHNALIQLFHRFLCHWLLHRSSAKISECWIFTNAKYFELLIKGLYSCEHFQVIPEVLFPSYVSWKALCSAACILQFQNYTGCYVYSVPLLCKLHEFSPSWKFCGEVWLQWVQKMHSGI